MKFAPFGLAAFAAALAVATPAAAQESRSLQVVANPQTNRLATISAFDPIGQSFTAFTDTITSVGFQFGSLNPSQPNDPITLSIFAGETLTGASLFTTNFTLPTSINSRTPTFFDIAVPNLTVTNGARYSLVLATGGSLRNAVAVGPGFNVGQNQFTGGDAYTGGRAFASTALYSNCPNTPDSNCDLNFRVTGNVVAAPVPEPGAWGMMLAGFLAVGSALRASRRPRAALTYC
ncbi:PEP-CTERM sorting domain-containing protein [Qipengyuania sediminis]|uniref:PEP-CTERM sorting domain-containing protein n=1 Tax=Qipengyuania sediminis TaxID=1532023 RepID=UPI00105A8449|nr:PEP-CTERM sorting domain-containing protein [Qipengyuania sediminis]